MMQLIRDILAVKHLRYIWVRLTDAHSPMQCTEAFVGQMNAKAKNWGMINTHWINPSGLGVNGRYSQTTARDLAIMGLRAMDYPYLQKMWQTGLVYPMHITKPYIVHPKKHIIRRIASTVESMNIGEFPILGIKTGAGDDYYTLVAICEIPGIEGYVSVAIMQASSIENRFEAMKEALFAAQNTLMGGGEINVTKARNACAYYQPKNGDAYCVYEQNADEVSAPMSTTKIMTLCVSLDNEKNTQRKIRIRPSDMKGTEGTSGNVFKEWEKVSLEDAMYAALLPSSNQAANAIAREIGKNILCSNK